MGKNSNGQGKGKPKLKDRDFGKALIKQQLAGVRGLDGRITKERKMMVSILDTSALSDYVDYIEMEGKEVQVKRTHMNDAFLVEPTTNQAAQHLTSAHFDYEHLKIPRKPAWTRSMTADDVDRNEKDAFLNWRREIAAMEEASRSRATPFEKNLEVWRQLWRVLERSDMAIQIVDARNPLLYYTSDLMQYASELSPPRPMMLLINKADFLTEHQRRVWATYFASKGIKFAFYSAHNEQEKIERAAQAGVAVSIPEGDELDQDADDDDDEEEDEGEDGEDEDSEDEDEEEDEDEDEDSDGDSEGADADAEQNREARLAAKAGNVYDREEVDMLAEDLAAQWGGAGNSSSSSGSSSSSSDALDRLERAEQIARRSRVLTRSELILLLTALPRRLGLRPQERNDGRLVVGMLGFPNVGKSSVINTILGVSKTTHGALRVAVSSTPGKTKHFQTLHVSRSLMLCDCPGLVFPSFMRSTGEMLCAGILPINQMRDYADPANVIAARVPQHLLEAAYGITVRRILDVKDNLERPPTGSEVLCAYCATKGYITNGTGRWDEFRACKEILRDFTDGLVLFAAAPPGAFDREDAEAGAEAQLDSASTADGNAAVDEAVAALTAVNLNSAVVPTDTSQWYPTSRARWLQDTENVMLRRERIAERLAIRRLKEAEEEEAFLTQQQQQQAGGGRHGPVEHGGMVFGDGQWDEGDEDEEDEDGDEDESSEGGVVRRQPVSRALPPPPSSSTSSVAPSLPPAPIMLSADGIAFDDESTDDEGDGDGEAGALTAQGVPKRDHKRLKHWGKKQKKLRDKNPYGEENGVVSYVAYSTNRTLGGGKDSRVSRQSPHQAYGQAFVRQQLPHHSSSSSVSVSVPGDK